MPFYRGSTGASSDEDGGALMVVGEEVLVGGLI
jgi:hypothetical protein